MKLSTMRSAGLTLWAVAALGLAPAFAADWAALGLFDQGTFYIDRDHVTREGEIRKVWTMLDYRQPRQKSSGPTYRSTRSLMEIQCKSHQFKALSLSYHSGTRGSGDVISNEGVIQEWQPIPPDTVLAKLAWTVCEG
jgi:hypothetical protein